MLNQSFFKFLLPIFALVGVSCLLSACQIGDETPSQQSANASAQVASRSPSLGSNNTREFGADISAAITAAQLRGINLRLDPLPPSAWQVLESTPAIQVGGSPDLHASVYVVFDANCPHCAKLYQRMQRDYFDDIPVRWVPIAFLKPDSAALAGAILASTDPGKSLNVNYRNYDFENHHGGYRPPADMQFHLASNHYKLKRHWERWGGRTPMITIRTQGGTVLQVLHDKGDGLRRSLELAAPPTPIRETKRGVEPKRLWK